MWDSLTELFGISKNTQPETDSGGQRQGLLDHLNLREWYRNLPPAKQQQVRNSNNVMGIGGTQTNLLDQEMVSSGTMTQQDFLAGVVKHAAKEGDIQFAEEVLPKAMSAKGRSVENEHFMYLSLIQAHYKERNNRNDAIENCVKYCKKDIEIADEFLKTWDGEIPRIPSFKRLAIIHENKGEYEKAAEICDMAIERNLIDKTKGGFEGRKERILNKMG